MYELFTSSVFDGGYIQHQRGLLAVLRENEQQFDFDLPPFKKSVMGAMYITHLMNALTSGAHPSVSLPLWIVDSANWRASMYADANGHGVAPAPYSCRKVKDT